ncbi:hypothetical protein FKW77_006239 [Venturia effusa]|uniref:Uncharacterized protein n=1 Tax=Venturia effusa TaxID=50376 RepID=A0A517LP44_9PEZI|nr:hypothetical protein FKW77_006239 [Venturia effusa]
MDEKKFHDLALAMPFSTMSKSRNDDELPRTWISKVKSYLDETIRDDIYLEIELLFLAFGIGIQDATTFPDYLCFASNQTGNTVFLAIKTADVGGANFPFSNIGFSLTATTSAPPAASGSS